MGTCPDCTAVDKHVKGDHRYEVIDIGAHVRNLKEFLRLRDNSPVFDVTLSPEEAGIHLDDAPAAASCRLDGSGC